MMLQRLAMNDVRIESYQLNEHQLAFTMHPKEAQALAKNDCYRHLMGWVEDEQLPTFLFCMKARK